jgi:hypothetical protein
MVLFSIALINGHTLSVEYNGIFIILTVLSDVNVIVIGLDISLSLLYV